MNEPTSKNSYVLDGQDNVTIAGNTTLAGLPFGEHNVTVYAWDDAGNVGHSETVAFALAQPDPFPTLPVLAVSAAAIVAGIVLLYFKRRKNAQTSLSRNID